MANNVLNKGKIIVIEGLDGSGKNTQSRLLMEKLGEMFTVEKLSFPDYDSPASAPVRMYLAGEFGEDPSCVNAYAAASFYAVDRVASYLKDWKKSYDNGTLFVLDRYSTSNMIYMTSKLPRNEWQGFIEWLCEFEYNRLGLPAPDGVIYLDMPIEVSQKLMTGRYKGDESKKDLHEKNLDFLRSSRESALFAAENQGWHIIPCSDGENPRTIEEISEDVYRVAKEILGL